MNPLAINIVEREISDLLASFPELVEDEEFRLDVIQGQTDALEVLGKLLSEEREAAFLSAAIRERMDALSDRRSAAERRKDAYRSLMLRIMTAANLTKVPLAEATLSRRAVPPAVLITDENAIPEEYQRHKVEIDKTKLKDALKAGVAVPGAVLSNGGETISVRT